MTSNRVRTDPALIRRALDLADGSTIYAAAIELGLHHRTVQRWLIRRDRREHPAWPTEADIAAWRADQEANAAARRAGAEQAYRYRQRVYLNRGPLQVPSHGTARRLQALAAIGWTQGEIAARLGVTGSRVGHLTNGMFPTVFPATAAAVAKVFDELCMVVPTDQPPTRRGEIRVHERARRRARERGWVTALAWDDIDDPNEKPNTGAKRAPRRSDVDQAVVERILDGEVLDTTPAEKREVMRRWLAMGHSEKSLCERMGWHDGRYTPRLEEAS